MPIFRKSSKEDSDPAFLGQAHRDPDAQRRSRKLSQGEVHDPILKAIHEEQPFQQQVNHQATSSFSPPGGLRDVFGNSIREPDRSNPSRPRDERPLDTIRLFDYACEQPDSHTASRLRDELETPKLGWNVRPGFRQSMMPRFDENPYAAKAQENVISFQTNGPGGGYQQQTYVPPKVEDKKKKRGLFGRKKN
jgi:hypothetical protein